MSKTKSDLVKTGVVSESYQYCMDGEYCSGYKEIDVEVTEYWKTGNLKNQPKEVKVLGSDKYYRMTVKNGWRIYYKNEKVFDNRNRSIGGYTKFIPNVTANTDSNYNKVNLGNW